MLITGQIIAGGMLTLIGLIGLAAGGVGLWQGEIIFPVGVRPMRTFTRLTGPGAVAGAFAYIAYGLFALVLAVLVVINQPDLYRQLAPLLIGLVGFGVLTLTIAFIKA